MDCGRGGPQRPRDRRDEHLRRGYVELALHEQRGRPGGHSLRSVVVAVGAPARSAREQHARAGFSAVVRHIGDPHSAGIGAVVGQKSRARTEGVKEIAQRQRVSGAG